MAAATYRIGTIDIDGREYVSDDVLDEVDAVGHLALTEALLILGGWKTERCECGCAIRARKGDLRQTVVAIPTDDIESLALAVGVLAPASHRAGLRAVSV